VPRKEALEFLAGATMLLSLPAGQRLCVPAKIFEYVRFEAWMLVLATPESATGRLLAGTERTSSTTRTSTASRRCSVSATPSS
jgi:hypothetical protein